MEIKVVEETPAVLTEYEKASIAFSVETYFRAEFVENGLTRQRHRKTAFRSFFELGAHEKLPFI